jgi:hypothetical protein
VQQSAQNDVQQNVLRHVLNVAHSISQRAQNVLPHAQSAPSVLLHVQLLVHSTSQLAQNVPLLVHSISQHAISQSLHVIVAQRPVAIANHILSLRHADAMSQKISVQMILISRQTWQMLISLMQPQAMWSKNLSAILVFQLP